MNDDQARAIRHLVETETVASLGTLHQGEPFVSMVPFALLPAGRGFVVHVSRLASHTRDMLENAAVSVMVTASPDPSVPPQARPRVTIAGTARACAGDDPDYPAARTAYLSRFPQSEPMFGFADFSLFVITMRSARFVGGFAQAKTIGAEALARILAGP